MADGVMPNKKIDSTTGNNEAPDWFGKCHGKFFVNFYMKHLDNFIVTVLAGFSLLVSAVTLSTVIFSYDINLSIELKKFFFAIGVLGIICPPLFAFIGRHIIYRSARKHIKIAKRSLSGEYKLDALKKFDAKVDDLIEEEEGQNQVASTTPTPDDAS